MKKIIIALLSVLFALTACTANGQNDTNTNDSADTAVSLDESSSASEEDTSTYYIIEFEDKSISIGGVAEDEAIAALGEPSSITEAPSCVYEGVDRLFNYGAFTLTTTPDADGNDRITEFSVISDAISLKNGITIGSDKAAVEAAFGTDYTASFGVLKFALTGAEISIVLDDNNCVSALTVTAK